MSNVLPMRALEFIVVRVCLSGDRPENAAVVVLDRDADRLYVKARQDWEFLAADETDAEAVAGLEELIESLARDHGAERAFTFIDTSFSGVFRATDRQTTVAADAQSALSHLYRVHVGARGAIPVIRLSAAAGGLSEESLVPGEPMSYVEPPLGVRAVTGMFAARVIGRSMEPQIPDGSLCLFRPHGGGSRNGQILLIEKLGSFDSTSQFTLKIYRSEKRDREDGTWEHERIRMIPLNPEFEEWSLTPDEFKVIAEFVAVLPSEE